MYLTDKLGLHNVHAHQHFCPPELDPNTTPTYSSCVQLEGLSIRCPSFRSLKSSSTGIPGYGEPPNVKISHIRTPNDHLRVNERKKHGSFKLTTIREDVRTQRRWTAGLTRHFGACRLCQTELLVPSTSPAAVPAERTKMR